MAHRCWFLLLVLPAHLVSAAAGGVYSNATLANLSSGAACRVECNGLADFEERLKEALQNTDINAAEVCRAVQDDHKVISCVLNFPATCIAYFTDLDATGTNCKKIGIDVTKAPAEKSNYTASSCLMCATSLGASQLRMYSVGSPTLAQCEAHCAQSASCSAFDYDASRSMCRTWTTCPPAARSKRFGCQWTVYSRPGFVAPTQKPILKEPPAGYNFWSTTTNPNLRTTRDSPKQLALASAATPCHRILSACQASVGVLFVLIQLW